ncbi:autotransporter outer membrane beta-barrel domain-containing protein [Zestomonas thermotolerans]|uniref:autotransporter outer membrane beta-barrel domain-containing protein n=1 Tax=Zestomonas thermotolerans TaxID=157784 RepID=UPI0009DE51E7
MEQPTSVRDHPGQQWLLDRPTHARTGHQHRSGQRDRQLRLPDADRDHRAGRQERSGRPCLGRADAAAQQLGWTTAKPGQPEPAVPSGRCQRAGQPRHPDDLRQPGRDRQPARRGQCSRIPAQQPRGLQLRGDSAGRCTARGLQQPLRRSPCQPAVHPAEPDQPCLPLANLRHSLNAGLNPAAATAQVGGVQGSSGLPAFDNKPAWVELVGNWQDIDGDANAASLDQHCAGIFVGYDNEVADSWYLGGALCYTKTDADIGHRDSEADIHSYSATLYGGKAFALDTQRQLNLLAGLSYTYHDIDSERKIRGLGQKLEADYGAHTAQLFGEAGYLVGQPDGRFVEPFAGLTVSYLEADAVQEKGGSAALHGDSENETLVTSSLGGRAQPPYELGNFGTVLRGSLAWEHAFGDERFDRTMSFADGSQDFRVRGVSMDRDTAVLGFGPRST